MRRSSYPPSDISFLGHPQTVSQAGLTFLGSMDGSQHPQVHPVPPVATASTRENGGATPHPSRPPMTGIHVGNVNKSIIADTVQNTQDVNFGNSRLSIEIAVEGSLTVIAESNKGGAAGASRGFDQSILAHNVDIHGGVTLTSSKRAFPLRKHHVILQQCDYRHSRRVPLTLRTETRHIYCEYVRN